MPAHFHLFRVEGGGYWQLIRAGNRDVCRPCVLYLQAATVSLPAIDAAIGTPLRVQIYARDVSICLEAPNVTSILNVLPATITGLTDGYGGQSLVRLQGGNQALLSHITHKSAVLPGLQVSMEIYVQTKGTLI